MSVPKIHGVEMTRLHYLNKARLVFSFFLYIFLQMSVTNRPPVPTRDLTELPLIHKSVPDIYSAIATQHHLITII